MVTWDFLPASKSVVKVANGSPVAVEMVQQSQPGGPVFSILNDVIIWNGYRMGGG